MVIIKTRFERKEQIIFGLRILTGLIWLGTAIRRLFIPTFEARITAMASGNTLFPSAFMEFAVTNWVLILLIVLSLEVLISFSLLTGTFGRAGALLATVNGFGIGMAGIGVSLLDLIVPWTAAVLSLILFLFSHPGMYKGIDSRLSQKNLPRWLMIWI